MPVAHVQDWFRPDEPDREDRPMIIDYSDPKTFPHLFHAVDAATGRHIHEIRPYWYADDRKAIYRSYDGSEARQIRTDRATDEVPWTEYYLPIRIIPKPGLSPEDRELALDLIRRSEEG